MHAPWADKPDIPRDPRTFEVAGLLLIAWILYGIAWSLYVGTAGLSPGAAPDSEDPRATIPIRVIGEVQRPGDYSAVAGATVADAVALAGGPTAQADLDRLNLSQGLLDRSALRVPSIEYGFQPIVYMNRSSVSELVSLSGIGPELAARIVRDREMHGPFRTARDLLRVRGIGPKKLETILEQGLLRGWGR